MMMMRPAGDPEVVVVLALMILLLPSAAAQPSWPLCDSSAGSYSAGSAFETNLLSLVSALGASASASPSLFASGSSPAACSDRPDTTVNGLLLCRGGIGAKECSDCGASLASLLVRACNHTRDATQLNDQCYLRVAGTDFLASPNNTGKVRVLSGNSVGAGVDVAAYDGAVKRLLNATAQYAVDHAAPAASPPPRLYFATGQLVGLEPQVPSIWSMAQCAGDLSPAQCRKCLDDLVAEWWWTGKWVRPNRVGARIAGSRCNMRSEVAQFYTGRPMVQLQMNGALPPELAPAPSTEALRPVRGVLVTIVTTGAVLLVAMVVACWCVCRRQARRHSGSITLGGMRVKIDQLVEYKYNELKKATGNFSKDAELGRGAFGVVYKGTLVNKKVVAVKKLQRKEKVDEAQFRNEVTILSGLKHKNLVKLDGYCVHQNQEVLLCYEYLPDGNLEDRLIHGRRGAKLTWKERLDILEGICKGLQYLHNESPNGIAIMHMDLKTDNILLQVQHDKKNGGVVITPKISDFGISMILETYKQHEYLTEIVGNLSCLPREFIQKGKASTKVDIYSFGLIILEVVTGKSRNSSSSSSSSENPNHYGEGLIKQVHKHWEKKDMEAIKDASMDTKCDHEIEKCIEIALDCLLEDPEKRPDIATVARRLNDASSSTPSNKRHPDQLNATVE